MSEIDHYMKLVAQLRRQAEIDTAALNRWKALADDLASEVKELKQWQREMVEWIRVTSQTATMEQMDVLVDLLTRAAVKT